MSEQSTQEDRQRLTATVYMLAALACAACALSRDPMAVARGRDIFHWFLIAGSPLLFVFAYIRSLLATSAPGTRRRRWTLALQGSAFAAATVLFPLSVLPRWPLPLESLPDSLITPVIWISLLVLQLTVALILLFRGKSSLATLGSVLFWPCWLALTLVCAGRFFREEGLRAVLFFCWCFTPVVFTFAAGAVERNPRMGNAFALAGILAAPWLYQNVMRDSGLGNTWLMFNLPDRELRYYPLVLTELAIAAVGLTSLAIFTAALRMLPARWQWRGKAVGERTWPAVLATVLFIAVWFSQSVLPYRIPGALDGAYPILQISHVEKRGLQFRETAVSVWQRFGDRPLTFSIAQNDRRLFQYRFPERHSGGALTDDLSKRVLAAIAGQTAGGKARYEKGDDVKPLRAWNVDGWYFHAQSPIRAYTSDNGQSPPAEVVRLFDDLLALPRTPSPPTDMKDVCLGFCYDPLSGMGRLYANHRCFTDDSGRHCR